jgi:hypothetical protein
LALLLTSRYPVIRKVVVFNPIAWSFQGLTLKKVSMWTYNGKQLPFIKVPWASFVAYVIGSFIKNRPLGFAYAYRKGLEIAKNREDARIKIENSNADILMFGGQKDGWWDTHNACLKMMDELEKHNYQHRYEYISYENGGHACYAPFVIPAGEFSSPLRIMPRLVFSEEVTWETNAQMIEDTWRRSIEFLKN